jgi:hypothetical protein
LRRDELTTLDLTVKQLVLLVKPTLDLDALETVPAAN